MMRRADRHDARELASAVFSHVRAHHEAAHAVRDDHDRPCVACREHRVDLAGELIGEILDRCERRTIREAVDAGDAGAFEEPRHPHPDAGIAEHAVQQDHRRLHPRRRGIAHEESVEHHARRGAGERPVFAPHQPRRRARADADFTRPARAPEPGDREITRAQEQYDGEIRGKQPRQPKNGQPFRRQITGRDGRIKHDSGDACDPQRDRRPHEVVRNPDAACASRAMR